MFIFNNRILSVDMGSHSYKLIEAKLKPELRIMHYGAYPKEQLLEEVPTNRELKRLGFHTRDAVLSYHHSSFMVREMHFPVEDNALVHLSIQDKIQQYETDFKEELDYDYTIRLQEGESEIYHATTVAVSKSINRNYIDQAIGFGLKPLFVDVQINAIQRVIKKAWNFDYLLVDFGYENISVGIGCTEYVPMLKVIPIGYKSLQEDSCQLEEILIQIQSACRQLMQYRRNKSIKNIFKRGILYGGGAYIPEIKNCLKEKIPLEWCDLQALHQFLPLVPDDLDLNIYGNCLGSLLLDEKRQQGGMSI